MKYNKIKLYNTGCPEKQLLFFQEGCDPLNAKIVFAEKIVFSPKWQNNSFFKAGKIIS